MGRYFAGSLLVALLPGLYVLTIGLVLGVPLAPLLGLWVAVFDLVPQIGGARRPVPRSCSSASPRAPPRA